MYTLVSVLHVVAAVVLVGPMALLPLAALRALRTGNAPVVALTARLTFLFSLASVAVAALGVGLLALVGTGTVDFSWGPNAGSAPLPPLELAPTLTTGWVVTSIGLYLAALAVSLLVVVPGLRRAGATPAESSAEGDQAQYGRIAVGSGAVALLLLLVTVLMVARPDTYSLLTSLHAVTGVAVVGPMAVLPLLALRALRTGKAQVVPVLAKATLGFSVASLVVAGLGFGILASIGTGPVTFGWSAYADPASLPPVKLAPTLTTGWVLTSIGLYVVALLLSLLVVVPLTQAGSELAAGRSPSASYGRIAVGSVLVALLLIAVTVLMVWRP